MQNIDTLLRFLFNVGIGNRENAEAALHPDFLVNEVESFPYGGTYKGAKGWWKLGAIVTSYWIFDEVELQRAIQSSEYGMVCLLVGIKARCRANGRHLYIKVCEIWTFKNGLIASVSPFFWDTAAMIKLMNESDESSSKLSSDKGYKKVNFAISPSLLSRWEAVTGLTAHRT